jgi:hypothetical protein
MFHARLFCRNRQIAGAITAALVVIGQNVIAPSAVLAQSTTGTFYDQNRPAPTGDSFLDNVLNGAQRDLSQSIIRSYLNGLEDRMAQALQPMETWYGPTQRAVRTWMHQFFTDERQRIGVSDNTPSASLAIAQQVTQPTMFPTGMDQGLTDELLGFIRGQIQNNPNEDLLVVGVRQFIQQMASDAVQPATIRQKLETKPWLARLIARFATAHPEFLRRFPWLQNTLAPYMPSGSQYSADDSPAQTEILTFDENAPRNQPTWNGSARNNSRNLRNDFAQQMARSVRQFQSAGALQATQPSSQQRDSQEQSESSQYNPTGNQTGTSLTQDDSNRPSTSASDNQNGYSSTQLVYDENAPRRQSTETSQQPSNDAGSATNIAQPSQDDFFANNSAQPIQQPVRQNRVYYYDGTSRPIGRGDNVMQQAMAQRQVARPTYSGNNGGYSTSIPVTDAQRALNQSQTPRYSPSYYGGSNSSSSTTASGTGSSSRLVFDDSVPRGQATVGYNENAARGGPSVSTSSAVSYRNSGTQAPTASTTPAVTPRAIGTRGATAELEGP